MKHLPTADPIWAVIEQHRAARAAYNKRIAIEITASGNIPDGAEDELMAAGRSLLTMRPTTLPGVIAVLRYVRSQQDEEDLDDAVCPTYLRPTYLPDEINGEFWAHAFFDTIADALSSEGIKR